MVYTPAKHRTPTGTLTYPVLLLAGFLCSYTSPTSQPHLSIGLVVRVEPFRGLFLKLFPHVFFSLLVNREEMER